MRTSASHQASLCSPPLHLPLLTTTTHRTTASHSLPLTTAHRTARSHHQRVHASRLHKVSSPPRFLTRSHNHRVTHSKSAQDLSTQGHNLQELGENCRVNVMSSMSWNTSVTILYKGTIGSNFGGIQPSISYNQ